MKFSFERIVQNGIPDLRDNLRSKEAPDTAYELLTDPADAIPLAEKLLLPEARQKLEERTADLEMGEYRARIAVGSAKEGTRHPHDYVIQKDPEGLTLYFVDPEHQVGMSKNRNAIPLPRKGDIRPKTSTLIGMKITNGVAVPDISLIRFRAEAIEDPRLLKMQPQLELAQEILATGNVPELLVGKENEITFRLNVRPDALLVQSRYVSQEELREFLHGYAKDLSPLKGKAHSFNVIVRHYLKHLASGAFQRTTEPVALKQAA